MRLDIIVFDFSVSADGVKPKPVLYRRAEGIITKEQFLQDVAKDVLIQSFVWTKLQNGNYGCNALLMSR